jgi:hypothetical protein
MLNSVANQGKVPQVSQGLFDKAGSLSGLGGRK